MAKWRNQRQIEVLSNWRWKSFRCPVASIVGHQITMAQPCWHNANVFFGPVSIGTSHEDRERVRATEQARRVVRGPARRMDLLQAGARRAARARGHRGGRDPGADQCTRHPEASGQPSAIPGSEVRVCDLDGRQRASGLCRRPDRLPCHGANQPQTFEHAQYTTRTPGNLRFAYVHDITIRGSVFEHLGAVALDFDTGSQHDTIVGNRFNDISAAAIQLGGVAPIDHHPRRPGQVTRDNRIADNTITKAAREFFDAAGIFVGYTTRTTIIHNTLSNLPYTGIAIGWGWGMTDPGRFPGCTGCALQHWKIYTAPTTSKGNRIIDNKVSGYLKLLYDGGGIYSLGQQGTSMRTGMLIAGNVVFGKGLGVMAATRYTPMAAAATSRCAATPHSTTLLAWTVPAASPTGTTGAAAGRTATLRGTATGGTTRPRPTTAIRRTLRSTSLLATTPSSGGVPGYPPTSSGARAPTDRRHYTGLTSQARAPAGGAPRWSLADRELRVRSRYAASRTRPSGTSASAAGALASSGDDPDRP